jgi:magnesium transporter
MAEEMKDLFLPQEEESVAPIRRDYAAELLELLQSGRPLAELRELIDDYHDGDLADVLEQLGETERKRLYRVLGTERMSDVFAYLEDVGTYLEELGDEIAADVIEGMDADDAVDVLEELDAEKRQELLELIDPEAAEDIQLIDSYEDDEIGSKMTTNFVAIANTLTIKQAMRSLICQAADNDNISTLYALNEDGTFYGAIALKDLIVTREDANLDDLIVTSYPAVYAHESIAACIEELKDYSEDSIPVLGEDNRLLGVITAQDIVEVVDEELGEDYAKLAGLTEEEDLQEPLLRSMRKRIPWLLVLLVLGMGVSGVVGLFEGVVDALPLIVGFQSLILGMAGNVGTQSLAVTIRVLMDDDLTGLQQAKLVFKEARIGLLNGLLLGMLSFGLIGLYLWLLQGREPTLAFAVSGCLGIALTLAMMVSGITGTATPILFRKLGVDPAVASGPLITTVNDLVAVVTYYGLAWLLLIRTMNLA